MKIQQSIKVRNAFWGLLIVVVLVGCAVLPESLAPEIPTIAPQPGLSPLTFSSPLPKPTCPPTGARQPCFVVPTLLPFRGIRVGPPVELPLTKETTPYSLERFSGMAVSRNTLVGMANESGQIKLYAIDLNNGHIRQIGTSNPGVAAMRASERYVVWNRDTRDVIAYDLQTGKETYIAPGAYPDVSGNIIVWGDWRNVDQGDSADIYGYDLALDKEFPVVTRPGMQVQPKIAGSWVAYLEIVGERDYRLRVHHLKTSEDFEVGAVPMFIPPLDVVAAQYFALGDNRLVWVPAQDPQSVRLYDLNTRTDHTLLKSDKPYLNLRLDSDTLVCFSDNTWIGYDLSRDTSFSIPRVPSDEWLGADSSLFLSRGRVIWVLTKDREQAQHLLTAWVERDK